MIYFVRHGSTDWNDYINEQGQNEPKCQGRADIPLNQKGINQAKLTAIALKDIKFDKVLCSPLKRAIQTCKIIYSGNALVEIDERLIERDFGEFEGLTRDQFDFYDFCNENSTQKFVKAESIEDVKKRVFSLLDELKENPNQNVLIVSHGGVGCVIMSYFYEVPNGNYSCFEMPHAKPLILDFNSNIKTYKVAKA